MDARTRERLLHHLKCDDRDRPIHDAGALADCPTCEATRADAARNWRPPRWQLACPTGEVYDYDRRPRNPLTRLALYLRGFRWHRYPWYGPGRGLR